MTIDENYMERLANAVAKTILDAIENLSIEDVNMYQIGYNKAIDDFAEKIIDFVNEFPTVEDDWGELRPMRIEEMCNVVAEQLKGEKQ